VPGDTSSGLRATGFAQKLSVTDPLARYARVSPSRGGDAAEGGEGVAHTVSSSNFNNCWFPVQQPHGNVDFQFALVGRQTFDVNFQR